MTSGDLIGLLRAKYPIPTYALIEQVPNGTASTKSRTADAIAMGCWHSKGIELQGFEVKVSRQDWLKEIKDLSKSAAFERHCHRWWIVADKGLVKLEEMPGSWGLMEPKGDGLVVKKGAELRIPELLPWDMLAGLLRRAVCESASEGSLKQSYDKGYAAGREREWGNVGFESKLAETKLEKLEDRIKQFEEQSGVKIDRWGYGNVAKDVKAVVAMRNNGDSAAERLRSAKARAESQLAHITEALKGFEGLGAEAIDEMDSLE